MNMIDNMNPSLISILTACQNRIKVQLSFSLIQRILSPFYTKCPQLTTYCDQIIAILSNVLKSKYQTSDFRINLAKFQSAYLPEITIKILRRKKLQCPLE